MGQTVNVIHLSVFINALWFKKTEVKDKQSAIYCVFYDHFFNPYKDHFNGQIHYPLNQKQNKYSNGHL